MLFAVQVKHPLSVFLYQYQNNNRIFRVKDSVEESRQDCRLAGEDPKQVLHIYEEDKLERSITVTWVMLWCPKCGDSEILSFIKNFGLNVT